jgi:hypothetical protein
VHEHRVDRVGLHTREGLLQARFAAQLAADIRLRRKEQSLANVELLRKIADHGLRRAVDHRGVHDLSAKLDESRHRVAQRRALLFARADAVAVRADADSRQHLTGLRDGFLNEGRCLSRGVSGAKSDHRSA